MLRIVLTVLLTVICIVSANLGFSWIQEGHGLHPAIAFPIATICMMLIALLLYLAMTLQLERDCQSQHNHRNTHHG